MRKILKDFWAAALSLAGLVGLYLAADAVGAAWVFVVVVVVAGVVALVRPIANWFIDVGTRYRKFPALLADYARMERQVQDLEEKGRGVEEDVARAHETGVKQGVRQVIGAGLATSMRTMPELIATSVIDDEVALIAAYEGQEPPIGAWLQVEVSGTGEVKGAVEVSDVRPEDGTVVLKCCEETVPRFWEDLVQRSISDHAPPGGVRLAPYTLPRHLRAEGQPEEVESS